MRFLALLEEYINSLVPGSCHIYIDDIAIFHNNKTICYLLGLLAIQIFQLVFKCRLNLDKSILYPSKSINLLGFQVGSDIKIYKHKIDKIRTTLDDLNYFKTGKLLMRLLGYLEAQRIAIDYDLKLNKDIFKAFTIKDFRTINKIVKDILNIAVIRLTPSTDANIYILFTDASKSYTAFILLRKNYKTVIKQSKTSLTHYSVYQAEKLALFNAMNYMKALKLESKVLVLVNNLPLILETQKTSSTDQTINNIRRMLIDSTAVIYWINRNINVSNKAFRNQISA